jgi:hypothetical protein
MGKLEPSFLVIPNPLGAEFVPKALPIEIKYFQEDHVGEIIAFYVSGRRPVTIITGANV